MAECPDCGATDRDIYNTLGIGFACEHAGCPMTAAYRDVRGQNPAAHVIAAYWDGIGDWVW